MAAVAASESAEMRSSSSRVLLPSAPAEPPSGALAARTAVRWRFSKQFYSQLLVSYQSSSRLGASDGALLYAVRLAEAEQTKQAILALHGLLREQLRSEREPNRVGAPGLDLGGCSRQRARAARAAPRRTSVRAVSPPAALHRNRLLV